MRIYVSKHRIMLQIDFGPGSWFPVPKSLRVLRTGTRFEKSWIKNRIFKKRWYALSFPGSKLWKFHKKYLQISREGVSNGEGFGRKVRKWAPKNIKKPCTRHKKLKCAEKYDSLKTINGANDLLCLLTPISRKVQNPKKFHEKGVGIHTTSGSLHKIIIESTPPNPL